MERFNINDYVWVRLTDRGREHHKKIWHSIMGDDFPYNPPQEVNGWSKWQMWVLMRDFGSQIGNGRLLVFETTISLIDPSSNPLI